MYRQHFGLGEHPFSLTPDTQFFFNSESHSQILSTVLLALRHNEGFIKIVGEVGTGKTLLCRMLLAGLGNNFKTVYIPNPYLTPEELKWFLAEELGITYSPSIPSYQLLKEINQHLIELEQQQRQVVLVVDEAQAMPRETMEALRLLTNLETEKHKLLQVVLIGQPELDELLNRPDLRQLKQRITFAEYLQGISRKSLISYVAFRLSSAGYEGKQLFSNSALALLYNASGGVPRLINVIAHKAMLAAYGEKSEQITRNHIAGAIADTQESRSLGRMLAKRNYWFWPSVTAVACISVLVVLTKSPINFNTLAPDYHNQQKVLATEIAETKNLAVEASASESSEQLQNRINSLIQQASRALAMNRLTLPAEDNAFGYYQAVLALVPNNPQAQAGLEIIAARYLAMAQDQMNQGNRTQADTFLQRANIVAPKYYRDHANINFLANAQSKNSLLETPAVNPAPVQSETVKPFIVAEASTITVAPNSGWKDEQMVLQATKLVEQEKSLQAVELLKTFIAGETKPVHSAELLATIYLQQGNTQAVEALLNTADYFSPVEKAKIKAQLLVAQGNTTTAISTLEQELSAADNNEQYGALLASLYHKTGQYQQSVISYQRLLKSYGEKPAYWLGLALAFDGLTQHNNALQAYQHLREFPQLQLPVKTYIDQRIAALRSE